MKSLLPESSLLLPGFPEKRQPVEEAVLGQSGYDYTKVFLHNSDIYKNIQGKYLT